MTESNEAAERLLAWFPGVSQSAKDSFKQRVDAALAAERRATVERIRERLANLNPQPDGGRILAILDEEAR